MVRCCGLHPGDQEQHSEEQVYCAEDQVSGMEAVLQIERDQRYPVGKLFEYGREHHGAEADGIAGDDREGELPSEASADEPVVEGGVRDRRRVLAADQGEHEVEGGGERTPKRGAKKKGFLGNFMGSSPKEEVFEPEAELIVENAVGQPQRLKPLQKKRAPIAALRALRYPTSSFSGRAKTRMMRD